MLCLEKKSISFSWKKNEIAWNVIYIFLFNSYLFRIVYEKVCVYHQFIFINCSELLHGIICQDEKGKEITQSKVNGLWLNEYFETNACL